MTDCWELVNTILPRVSRGLLYGPPGTGKTTAAVKLGVQAQQTVYNVTVTEETPASELRGHFIPRGHEFIWHDGPVMRAWREGARLVINEINHASGDVMTLLLAILDDHEIARLTLPTGETVIPSPAFTCVATMNGDPNELPEALLDRFPVTILVDKVNPLALCSLPTDLRVIVERTSTADERMRRIGIRKWKEYARLVNFIPTSITGPAIFGERWKDVSDALAIGEVAWPDRRSVVDTKPKTDKEIYHKEVITPEPIMSKADVELYLTELKRTGVAKEAMETFAERAKKAREAIADTDAITEDDEDEDEIELSK